MFTLREYRDDIYRDNRFVFIIDKYKSIERVRTINSMRLNNSNEFTVVNIIRSMVRSKRWSLLVP